MKISVEEVDEIATIACDLCHYPYVITSQQELEDKCEGCPLVERLMKEVDE